MDRFRRLYELYRSTSLSLYRWLPDVAKMALLITEILMISNVSAESNQIRPPQNRLIAAHCLQFNYEIVKCVTECTFL